MDMKRNPTDTEIADLFVNNDPSQVWEKAHTTIARFNPAYDFVLINSIFDDVMSLFSGEFEEYGPIKTLYHDRSHTLDVFMCAVRLMHGLHIAHIRLSDDELTLVLVAALMHDIGYAQRRDEQVGTGAQFTQTHVQRGIDFSKQYLSERKAPPDFAGKLEYIIRGTDTAVKFAEIDFPDERTRLLGQIVVTADLTGQMADRTYLEKLLYLYLEFEEAHFGGFADVNDLLRKSKEFYLLTRAKLDGPFGGLYVHLSSHFKESMGNDTNYYIESIEKNIAYLEKVVTTLNEADYLTMLKRGGIVDKALTIPPLGSATND